MFFVSEIPKGVGNGRCHSHRISHVLKGEGDGWCQNIVIVDSLSTCTILQQTNGYNYVCKHLSYFLYLVLLNFRCPHIKRKPQDCRESCRVPASSTDTEPIPWAATSAYARGSYFVEGKRYIFVVTVCQSPRN